MLLMAVLPVALVYAVSSGPRNAGAGADVTGIGTVAWGTPGNITTPGSPYATMTVQLQLPLITFEGQYMAL
jgi:hypothetical protein